MKNIKRFLWGVIALLAMLGMGFYLIASYPFRKLVALGDELREHIERGE
jgi:hypothetical protein